MKKTTMLFDLDGTLLPMDQDLFLKKYFEGLTNLLVGEGFERQLSFNAVMAGTRAMILNDGKKTNEKVFWETFTQIIGYDFSSRTELFDNYYMGEFENSKSSCGFNPLAKEAVDLAKSMGMRVVLATNPVCPAAATYARIRWAGFEVSDFEYVTTYENSCYSKPNPEYYREILDKLGISADECIMVGNDTSDDLAAEKLGMEVFLVTDCLLNKKEIDISKYPNGDFNSLKRYIMKKED